MAEVAAVVKKPSLASKIGTGISFLWSNFGAPIVKAKADAETAKYEAQAATLRREAGITERIVAAAPAVAPYLLVGGGVGLLALVMYLRTRR